MAQGRRRGEETRGRGKKAGGKGSRRSQEDRNSKVRREERTQNRHEGQGRLSLIGTPIGNLGDLSPRALAALQECDLVIAEDTRVALKLLSANKLSRTILRFDDHASQATILKLLGRIAAGERICLVSDAGMPVISDPGAKLVDEAYAEGLPVDVVPGPSAVTAALGLSGFFGQKFTFLGYLSRSASKQIKELSIFRESTMPVVLFESPHRVEKTLDTAFQALGPRRFAVCKEMTKLHQEVIRGRLGEPIAEKWMPKGEITIVIEGRKREN